MLADDGGGSIETDILIGADLYWLLVDGEVKKKDCSGLVAIRSKFGWLVHLSWLVVQFQGLILRTVLQKVICRLLTYCVWQNFSDAEAKLSEEVKKIWDLNSVGIRVDEVSAYEKHAS